MFAYIYTTTVSCIQTITIFVSRYTGGLKCMAFYNKNMVFEQTRRCRGRSCTSTTNILPTQHVS